LGKKTSRQRQRRSSEKGEDVWVKKQSEMVSSPILRGTKKLAFIIP
jgi:hypothetical protein